MPLELDFQNFFEQRFFFLNPIIVNDLLDFSKGTKSIFCCLCRGRGSLLFIQSCLLARGWSLIYPCGFPKLRGLGAQRALCLSYVPTDVFTRVLIYTFQVFLLENIPAFGLHIFPICLWSSANSPICYRGCARDKGVQFLSGTRWQNMDFKKNQVIYWQN